MIASKTDPQLTKVKCAGRDQDAIVMLVSMGESPHARVRRIAEVVAAEACAEVANMRGLLLTRTEWSGTRHHCSAFGVGQE